jgi:hypothetical protein
MATSESEVRDVAFSTSDSDSNSDSLESRDSSLLFPLSAFLANKALRRLVVLDGCERTELAWLFNLSRINLLRNATPGSSSSVSERSERPVCWLSESESLTSNLMFANADAKLKADEEGNDDPNDDAAVLAWAEE